MDVSSQLQISTDLALLRLEGRSDLTTVVDDIAAAIGRCRHRGLNRLLVNTTGVTGVAIPSLVDRFLAVEEWATIADGLVVVALVARAEYIDPGRFGLKVAAHFGLMANVFVDEADARAWLEDARPA